MWLKGDALHPRTTHNLFVDQVERAAADDKAAMQQALTQALMESRDLQAALVSLDNAVTAVTAQLSFHSGRWCFVMRVMQRCHASSGWQCACLCKALTFPSLADRWVALWMHMQESRSQVDAEREEWQQALLERCQTLQDELEAVRKQHDAAAAAVAATTSAAATSSAAAHQVRPVVLFLASEHKRFHHRARPCLHGCDPLR